MLYTKDLSKQIFENPPDYTDELCIISGYVGPTMVEKALTLGLKLNILYGMTGSDGISSATHDKFKELEKNNHNLNVYYTTPGNGIHSKCYIWKYKEDIVRVLTGSANFTYNGLNFPGKELLIDIHPQEYPQIQAYCNKIFSGVNIESCLSAKIRTKVQRIVKQAMVPGQIIVAKKNGAVNTIRLYFTDNRGNLPPMSGLNWGHGTGHVNPNDSYIPIRKAAIKTGFFNPKAASQIPIDALWDDGTTMAMYEEGNQTYNSQLYPKNLASAVSKKILGKYFRKRLGVPSGAKITLNDLNKYGKTYVDVTETGPNSYYIDFS